MPVNFVNTATGAVRAVATPEEAARASAQPKRAAARRAKMLEQLDGGNRWNRTSEPERPSDARRAAQQAESDQQMNAELERLREENAKLREQAGSDGDAAPAEPARTVPEGPAPSQAQVRAWAREQGYEVPARGRVPDEVVAAYEQAHQDG